MKRLGILAASIAVLTGAVFVSTMEFDHPTRPVRLEGVCPEAAGRPECKALVQHVGWCLCLTDETSTLDGEVASAADMPAGVRRRLVVRRELCRDGQGRVVHGSECIEVRREPPGVLCDLPDCIVAAPADAMVMDLSMTQVQTPLDVALAKACDPCLVRPGSWGRCPRCLLTTGGCEAACGEE